MPSAVTTDLLRPDILVTRTHFDTRWQYTWKRNLKCFWISISCGHIQFMKVSIHLMCTVLFNYQYFPPFPLFYEDYLWVSYCLNQVLAYLSWQFKWVFLIDYHLSVRLFVQIRVRTLTSFWLVMGMPYLASVYHHKGMCPVHSLLKYVLYFSPHDHI